MSFYITLGFSLAIVIISLLIIKIGETGFSFWYFVWLLIPGVSALRIIVRFNHFLSLPAGIVIAYFLSERIRVVNKNYIKYGICIILVTVFFAEHQNTGKTTHWTKSQIISYLENTSAPPEDCESFLLVNNTVSEYAAYQLDAWTIANKYNIKTINGYSGQFPKNWHYILWMDLNRNYYDILLWIDKHKLENVYLYDYKNNNWIKCTDNAIEELYEVIN